MGKINVSSDLPLQSYFPLKKYGYTLERPLNNENRWYIKIVCSVLDRDCRRYVSTTYTKENEYLKLLKILAFLNRNNKLSPKIAKLYPKDKTIACEYIGEFLFNFLLKNPADISLGLSSVFDYLKDINSINQSYKTFVIPSILKIALQLPEEPTSNFKFLPQVKVVLPKLENSTIKFTYGYGIEDPHIWNFRVEKILNKNQTLTTDFDYFSDRVNCFWELGYLYATFRWFKKPLTCRAEEILLSLSGKQDLKSEFMFWLGVLCSYCGYKDSLRNFMRDKEANKLRDQYRIIHQLDEKVSFLANRLLWEKGY